MRELSGEIETKRLLLRRWSEHDAQALYQLCLDPELRRSGIHWYESAEESGQVLRHWKDKPEARAIVRREDQQLIGMISLEDMNRYPQYKELEYAIAAQERGNGYAVEADEAMLRYAFLQRDISVVAAWVRAFNQPSVRVLQRCRFTHEGTLRRHARDKGDTLCYSILKEEWMESQKENLK